MNNITFDTADCRRLVTPQSVIMTYERFGTGPPLLLVHGAFDDPQTNWQRVAPELARHFSLFAIARRGRGATDATKGHSVADEAGDVAALIEAIGEPVHLLGHSYGAQVALAAAARVPQQVRKLALYEPPWPDTVSPAGLHRFEALARAGEWEALAASFFHDELGVPREGMEAMRADPAWCDIVADAEASLGDIRAMCSYRFDPRQFHDLHIPVMLQIGSESPREVFATDALAAALPDVRIAPLLGQGHEAMKTAPGLYARQVIDFLRE